MENAKNIVNVFEDICKNLNTTLNILFEIAAKKSQIFDEENKVPRLGRYQRQRSNINVKINRNPMEWFKITIFIQFLDHIIKELKCRFSDEFAQIIPLKGFIPGHRD